MLRSVAQWLFWARKARNMLEPRFGKDARGAGKKGGRKGGKAELRSEGLKADPKSVEKELAGYLPG